MSAEFFRVRVIPPSVLPADADPFFSAHGWFVREAARPREASDGRSYFGRLVLTPWEYEAAVFSAITARNVLAIVAPFNPHAELVPSDFAAWVEAMPATS